MSKENTIIIYHSIHGVDKPPTELEVDQDYVGSIFQYWGVDYWDKQRDEVLKIWKELDGWEYESDCDWDKVGEMMIDDDRKLGSGYKKRMWDLKDEFQYEIDGLIDKHDLGRWKYHTYEEFEDDDRNLWGY